MQLPGLHVSLTCVYRYFNFGFGRSGWGCPTKEEVTPEYRTNSQDQIYARFDDVTVTAQGSENGGRFWLETTQFYYFQGIVYLFESNDDKPLVHVKISESSKWEWLPLDFFHAKNIMQFPDSVSFYACSSWYSSLSKYFQKRLQVTQNKVVRFINKYNPRSCVRVLICLN